MMMINKSCIEGCLLDVQSPLPVENRHMKLYQWAQADKEFLRILTMNKQDEVETSSSSSSPLGTARAPTNLHESYAWRQRYLRSYTFTQKQTATQKTKKWINEKKKTYLIKPNNNNNPKNVSASGSCSFFGAVLKFMLLCVAKVDVHEN